MTVTLMGGLIGNPVEVGACASAHAWHYSFAARVLYATN